jgi:hypothetical protein
MASTQSRRRLQGILVAPMALLLGLPVGALEEDHSREIRLDAALVVPRQ